MVLKCSADYLRVEGKLVSLRVPCLRTPKP